jgi:hypothetical protein
MLYRQVYVHTLNEKLNHLETWVYMNYTRFVEKY